MPTSTSYVQYTPLSLSAFNSLFEMPLPECGVGERLKYAFNSLFEMPETYCTVESRPEFVKLSILYLRCVDSRGVWVIVADPEAFNSLFEMPPRRGWKRRRLKNCSSFNSLFEMPGSSRSSYPSYRSSSFNSLFEMPRSRRGGLRRGLTCLSILYLRCRHTGRPQHVKQLYLFQFSI